MDDSLSNRALTEGLPPTNISYAEFVGMRVKTLSYMSFKNNQGEFDVFLPGMEEHRTFFKIEEGAEDLTQMMNQSLSKVKVKVEEGKVRVRRNPERRARVRENSIQPLSIQNGLIY